MRYQSSRSVLISYDGFVFTPTADSHDVPPICNRSTWHTFLSRHLSHHEIMRNTRSREDVEIWSYVYEMITQMSEESTNDRFRLSILHWLKLIKSDPLSIAESCCLIP